MIGIFIWVLCGDSKYWYVVVFVIILEGCKWDENKVGMKEGEEEEEKKENNWRVVLKFMWEFWLSKSIRVVD